MKKLVLIISNLAGTAFLTGIVQYLPALAITRLAIALFILAVIACYFWFNGTEDNNGWFYAFICFALALMDVLILADNSSVVSHTDEFILLSLLNLVVYWILAEIGFSPQDDCRPPEK